MGCSYDVDWFLSHKADSSTCSQWLEWNCKGATTDSSLVGFMDDTYRLLNDATFHDGACSCLLDDVCDETGDSDSE